MCNNVCQDVGTPSIETVKLRFFLYLSRGDFLQIGVVYSIFEHFCEKKIFFFSFLHLISVFPCYIFPLFGFQSKFRGKKRNIKNTKLDPKTVKGFLKVCLVAVNLRRILQSEDKFYRCFRENSGKIQFGGKKNRNSFPSAPTVFVGVKIVRQINLHFFILFWPARGGGPKLKTVAVNVERQRRKIYRWIFAKIVVIRSPPLYKMWVVIHRLRFLKKRLLSLSFFQETPVTIAKFLRNAGNRRYFSTNYRRFREFFSADPPLS